VSYRKGFINTEDLKEVFSLLGENVSDDEVNSKHNKLLKVNSDD
jgi:Ca2+-binding EF-hand superfamily protein